MQKTFIIGDVHGCLEELLDLMQLLDPSVNDQIFFIGDLIDRGPDSVGVVRQVLEWSKQKKVRLIIGNHEEKFLRYVQHLQNGLGIEKKMKGTEEFDNILSGLKQDELLFLQQGYHSWHIPEWNVLLVHAGVPFHVSVHLPESYPWLNDYKETQKKHLSLLNKTRFLNSTGKFITLGEETDNDFFWAEKYDGKWGHIYFGHQAFLQSEPKRFFQATGIDTGCVYGGWLSAVEISSNGVRNFSVPAKRIYAIK